MFECCDEGREITRTFTRSRWPPTFPGRFNKGNKGSSGSNNNQGSNPGDKGKGKGSHPGQSHKCTHHNVAYIVSGTLINQTLSKNADGTCSGTLEVEVTHTNSHAVSAAQPAVRGLLCGLAPPGLGAALSGLSLDIVNPASADSSMFWPRRVSRVKGLSHKFVSFVIYVVFSSWPVADLRAEG